MLIDSPYFPDELDALPSAAGRRGLRARRAARDPRRLRPPARAGSPSPGMALGARARARVERLQREPGGAQRELRDYDAEFYVTPPRAARARAGAGAAGAGQLELGDGELELHPAEGHTADGMAVFDRALGRAGAWATTSRTWRSRGSRWAARSRTTAPRSRGWRRWSSRPRPWCRATASPHDRDTALRLLDEDVAYLDALERGDERRRCPQGRDSQGPARDPRGEPHPRLTDRAPGRSAGGEVPRRKLIAVAASLAALAGTGAAQAAPTLSTVRPPRRPPLRRRRRARLRRRQRGGPLPGDAAGTSAARWAGSGRRR